MNYLGGITGIDLDTTFFALSMIILGIPHGAVDHLIDRKVNGPNNSTVFYAIYLFSIILMALIWTFSKPAGFILFLLITVYHFGITDVQRLESISEKRRKIAGIGRGLFVVSMLLLSNPSETFGIISNIISQDVVLPNVVNTYSSVIVFVMLFIFTIIISSIYSYNLANKELKEFFVDSLLLTVIFTSTSTVVGFAIYFSFWHSLKHLEEIYDLDDSKNISSSLRRFYWDALPFSAVSFFGIAILFALFSYGGLQQSLLSVSLILVSALTLPHVIVVEQFYKSRNLHR
jgi:Brp/Blh family beta-carotene 15,15'-monooxygenase